MAEPAHRIEIDWSAAQTCSGVFVEVYGLGVLLAGGSGVGKSELALELVSRGHKLIADDAVELARAGSGLLLGRCPALLKDFLEVRGLGLLDVRKLYGDAALAEMQRLDLILNLEHRPDAPGEPAERLSGRRAQREILGVGVPELFLRARLGHNQRALVEAACRDHWLRLFGCRADRDFSARQQAAVLGDRSGA